MGLYDPHAQVQYPHTMPRVGRRRGKATKAESSCVVKRSGEQDDVPWTKEVQADHRSKNRKLINAIEVDHNATTVICILRARGIFDGTNLENNADEH